MTMANAEMLVYLSVLIVSCHQSFGAWNNDKVKLKDISVLTLYDGRYTSARRGSPIPQLKCVGGSACSAFRPQAVQCYNRGSDGIDVQWECKTDMDNAFRFGKVEVSCEGYDYPEDDYILKGSCGLEYTLEYTKEGHQQQQQRSHDYYGSQRNTYDEDYHNRPTNTKGYGSKAKSVVGDVIFLCVIGGVVYVIYKTCVANNNSSQHRTHSNNINGNHGNQYNQGPPPPGFRPETYPDDHCGSTYNDGYTYNQGYGHRNQNRGFGGFWSGAATGGLLGYMFGNRNNGHYGSRTYAPNTGSSFWGNSYQSPFTSFSSRSSGSSFGGGGGGSTGTRTASGFGGTKRR